MSIAHFFPVSRDLIGVDDSTGAGDEAFIKMICDIHTKISEFSQHLMQ